MSDAAPPIEVRNVGKRFRMRGRGERSLKTAVLDSLRGRGGAGGFWALREVSFSVRRGECLGIIGSNGAGKSTLLSLLAGTKTPTEGAIRTAGVVSSLLELGAGFHPDLTGRENVFLSGAVIGVPRARMRERFDAIVEFAGIAPFIDQPVRHYSSGMYVRLGFAVAVEVDPDILLIDEVLAVGDAEFQRKCLDRMAAFREQGKTMLIISHDLATIQSVSDRILLLDEGRVAGLGDPGQVVGSYQSLARGKAHTGMAREWGTGEARITGVEFRDGEGRETSTFRTGGPLEAVIGYSADARIERPVFGFTLADRRGRAVFGSNTQLEGVELDAIEGQGRIVLRIEALSAAAGSYLFSFSLHSWDHRVNYHRLDNAFAVGVESDKTFEGCYMPTTWSLESR